MISFELFEIYMKKIEFFNKESDELNENINKICKNTNSLCEVGYHLLDGYIDILSKLVDDEDDWISYFVFECNFGKKPMNVTLSTGKNIKMNSIKKLWKVINAK